MMKQIVLGVAVVAAVSGCSRGGGDPKSVVQEFTSKGESGNCTGLRDYLVASQKESLGSVAEQGCQMAAQAKQGGAPTPATEVLDATENGDRATVKTRSGGQETNVTLVKENGAWKIDLQASMGAM